MIFLAVIFTFNIVTFTFLQEKIFDVEQMQYIYLNLSCKWNKISDLVYVCLFLQFDLDKFSEVFTDLKWFEGKTAERSEKEQMEGNSRKVCRILHVSVKLLNNFNQINYADALIDICTCVYL